MSMILHCGAELVTIEDVGAVATPDPTETWFPIPHTALLDTVDDALEGSGFNIVSREYGLWQDGANMFALLGLENGSAHPDYQLNIGIRNSHMKLFSAGFAVGSSVFICDNLAFSSDVTFGRKHTRWIVRDLPRLVLEGIGQLGTMRDTQDRRIEAYKRTELGDVAVHDILIRAVDAKVMSNSHIAKVLKEWRGSKHEEFEARTAWSLFNGFTEVFKSFNPFDLQGRTQRLHGLLDLASVDGGNDPNQIVLDVPVEPVALLN